MNIYNNIVDQRVKYFVEGRVNSFLHELRKNTHTHSLKLFDNKHIRNRDRKYERIFRIYNFSSILSSTMITITSSSAIILNI